MPYSIFSVKTPRSGSLQELFTSNVLNGELETLEKYQPTAGQLDGARLSFWQEQKAKRYMVENMSSGVLISTVARVCLLSRSHFSRAFRNSTGTSPRDWVRQARLMRATNLLERTDFAIAQVGLECGFADQSHFNRTFAKAFGMTPGKWRGLKKIQNAGF